MLIIAVEVLERSLNKPFEDSQFIRYEMPKWCPKINHLLYANDTILFCLGHFGSMKKMIKVLREYENMYEQMVNLEKSLFNLYEKNPTRTTHLIRRIIGISQGT